jgi:chromosome segregation ATPase
MTQQDNQNSTPNIPNTTYINQFLGSIKTAVSTQGEDIKYIKEKIESLYSQNQATTLDVERIKNKIQHIEDLKARVNEVEQQNKNMEKQLQDYGNRLKPLEDFERNLEKEKTAAKTRIKDNFWEGVFNVVATILGAILLTGISTLIFNGSMDTKLNNQEKIEKPNDSS